VDKFISGQRWISNAELQLGLGTLIEVGHRTISLHFIASDETRTYAKDNAPLSRVIYDQGVQVYSIDGVQIHITQVVERDGLVTYHGHTKQGEDIILEETQLDHQIQLNRPAERLFIGQIDKNYWFKVRYQSQKKNAELNQSELFGLTGARTSLIAHQLYIAHEVATRYAPRVLLADEVGLGKTIEAGLIIHHQLLNEYAQRVFIVVPESLLHQWLLEMLRRFNLLFSIFDSQRCQAETYTEDQTKSNNKTQNNPFLSEQLVLCSLEFLAQNPEYHQYAQQGEWDLLVVDEAHHLQWHPQAPSHEYQLIEQLSQSTAGVLLLTATPEQLGIESHFARLRLLDPNRFPNLEAFIAEEKSYQPIAQVMESLLSEQALDADTLTILKNVLTNIPLSDTALSETEINQPTNKQAIIEQLLDRHGTGRVLFRNTRKTISGFPIRKVFAHALPIPDDYAHVLEHFCSTFNTLSGKHSDQHSEEDNFSPLVLFPERLWTIAAEQDQQTPAMASWTETDPRVPWLAQWLLEQRQNSLLNDTAINKTLVITAHASSAIELAETLKTNFGIHAAVFHEGLSLIERDRFAAFFADTENGASVLICSEIGSEGRNFQFAHQMVLFDLPLNPDLLEQRIGRLDRIGQTKAISIHVPYLQGSAQESLFHWYHQGLNAFEQTCPAGHNVFTQLQSQLTSLLMQLGTMASRTSHDKALHLLIEQTQDLHSKLNTALHEGRDQLLEYNSCRQPQADQLCLLAEQNHSPSELRHYMQSAFDAFGIEHSEHSDRCYIIAPSEHMIHQFPGLPDDGMIITYNRSIALANEDIQFFTWEHPIVRTAMDMILSNELGNTAMTTIDSAQLSEINDTRLKPGSLLLECIFILPTSAHKSLHVNRYLPANSIRILVDEHHCDLSEHISHHDIHIGEANSQRIKKNIAQQIIQVKEENLKKMIAHAEQICLQHSPKLLDAAKKASEEVLMNEVDRLKALAQVNPNIRGEEIDFFAQQLASLDELFTNVKPSLDALRAIIVT